MFRALLKANVGRGSNTEDGIAKPVVPFHHSRRTAVNNLLQKVLRCSLLITVGGRKFLGHFDAILFHKYQQNHPKWVIRSGGVGGGGGGGWRGEGLYLCPSVCVCFFQIFDLDLFSE